MSRPRAIGAQAGVGARNVPHAARIARSVRHA